MPTWKCCVTYAHSQTKVVRSKLKLSNRWSVQRWSSCQRWFAYTLDQQHYFRQWREACQTLTGVRCPFYGSTVCVCVGKPWPCSLVSIFSVCLAHFKYVNLSFMCHNPMHYVFCFRHFPLSLQWRGWRWWRSRNVAVTSRSCGRRCPPGTIGQWPYCLFWRYWNIITTTGSKTIYFIRKNVGWDWTLYFRNWFDCDVTWNQVVGRVEVKSRSYLVISAKHEVIYPMNGAQ